MHACFLIVVIAVSECLTAYRYGRMSGQIPLGDEAASTTSISVQECGKFCGDSNSPGLIYHTGTSTCTCYAPVKGFADTVDSSQLGYVQADDTYTSCMTVSQHQEIIRNMVYNGAKCPRGFSNYCDSRSVNITECLKYGAFMRAYDSPHCQLYAYGIAN